MFLCIHPAELSVLIARVGAVPTAITFLLVESLACPVPKRSRRGPFAMPRLATFSSSLTLCALPYNGNPARGWPGAEG